VSSRPYFLQKHRNFEARRMFHAVCDRFKRNSQQLVNSGCDLGIALLNQGEIFLLPDRGGEVLGIIQPIFK